MFEELNGKVVKRFYQDETKFYSALVWIEFEDGTRFSVAVWMDICDNAYLTLKTVDAQGRTIGMETL